MLVITGRLVHSVSTARGEPRDIVVEADVIADIVAPGQRGTPMPKSSTPAAA
jgi:hypothetical protein